MEGTGRVRARRGGPLREASRQGLQGAAGSVSASRFPGLSRPLPVALGTAGQTHLSSWQALMLAHRLGSLTAPNFRKAFSYLGGGVRRGLGDSSWLLRPRVRPPGFSLPVVWNLGFPGNGIGGSSPGTTSVHTLATPPTTSQPRIRLHFCRKSPSARAQIPNVVASSSAEMSPATFTCSTTSCERARLSPRSQCSQHRPRGAKTSLPSPICLPVLAPTSRGPNFQGVSPPSSAHSRGPPPPPPP